MRTRVIKIQPSVDEIYQSVLKIRTRRCFSHSAYWLPTRKNLLYTVANPARGLLNRDKKKKEKVWQRTLPLAARSEKKLKITRRIYILRRSALRRSRSVSRPYKDSFDSSARPGQWGVASQNSTLPCATTTFPISLPLSSPGDVLFVL